MVRARYSAYVASLLYITTLSLLFIPCCGLQSSEDTGGKWTLPYQFSSYIFLLPGHPWYSRSAGLLVNMSSDRSCTRGMFHNKIHLISPGCPRPSIALTVQLLTEFLSFIISKVVITFGCNIHHQGPAICVMIISLPWLNVSGLDRTSKTNPSASFYYPMLNQRLRQVN